jgi:hypothetical protein
MLVWLLADGAQRLDHIGVMATPGVDQRRVEGRLVGVADLVALVQPGNDAADACFPTYGIAEAEVSGGGAVVKDVAVLEVLFPLFALRRPVSSCGRR